jgi:DNA primase
MRYGQGLLDEILKRIDLVQLVGRRVKLVRKGHVFWGCCPFHKEKSPSFKVENDRRLYKCFGCGVGGDAFKWLVETEGLTFPEAVERLAGEAGVELPKWSPADEARETQRKSLYEIVEMACGWFEQQLLAPSGAQARAYLALRGLDEGTTKRFRLGYAPGGSALVAHLAGRSVSQSDLIAAGLAREPEDGRAVRDFFYDRLIFPIADARGRVVAFGARALAADAKPKYLNTGETPLFSKGHLLYNFASARTASLKAGTIVVSEGYMDVIALARAGIEAAVAPLGTALTEHQLELLWRTTPEPVLAFDGDDAGLKAARRAAQLALPLLKPGHSLRFAFLPTGEDPDSLFRSQGAAAVRRMLEAAEPLSDVLWKGETEGRDFATPERRAGLEQAVRDIVGRIADRSIADYYRRDFEQRIFERFKRRAAPRKFEYTVPRRPGPGGKRVAPLESVSAEVKNSLIARTGQGGASRVKEFEVAALLVESPELALSQGEILAALPFSDPALDSLRHELLNLAASGFRLENRGVKAHLVRSGLSSLVERLEMSRQRGHALGGHEADGDGNACVEDPQRRWILAVRQWRELVESEPARQRALQRFNLGPTEETWREAQRLFAPDSGVKE